jgi:hypothetical protein
MPRSTCSPNKLDRLLVKHKEKLVDFLPSRRGDARRTANFHLTRPAQTDAAVRPAHADRIVLAGRTCATGRL